MSSLRSRLVLALLAVVLIAVGTATFASLRESTARLQADQARRQESAAGLLDAELAHITSRLDRALDDALAPRGGGAALGVDGDPSQRWLWASGQLEARSLDVLNVSLVDGQILTSGHWPASLGAIDPSVPGLSAREPGRRAELRELAVPQGSRGALLRWRRGRWGASAVVATAGRFLDAETLDALRGRSGADLLAFCSEDGPCLSSRGAELAELPAAFDPTAPAFTAPLRLSQPTPGVWVGIDQRSLSELQRRVRLRALSLGAVVALFALGVGVTLSRRVVQPVEALSAAAAALAQGDLSAAERLPPSSIREVQALLTAFQAMGRDLRTGREELVQAERVAAWREIARGLAHELKNPLTPIQASMDVIRRARSLDRPDFDEILEEQAGAVVQEVQRLKELADSFARFARLPEPNPEPLDPAALLDQVASLYAGQGTVIERNYPRPPLSVAADQTQLQTALTNLVKNAEEAASERPDPRVHLSVTATDGGVAIAVHDSGPGLAPEIVGRLFTPYVTTKGSRGTGLGLALVHRIAIEHGGSVRAGPSPILAGACFTLFLPIASPGVPSASA